MINVIIKKSTNPKKKYDAFINDNDKKISFGATGYSDYTIHTGFLSRYILWN